MRATTSFLRQIITSRLLAHHKIKTPFGSLNAMTHSITYRFSNKHQHQHGPNCNHSHHQDVKSQQTQQKDAPKEHQHGPNCNHEQHQHQQQHQHEHVHGPNCNHQHEQDNQNQAKLSILSFDQLIQLNTEDSLRFAESKIAKEEKIKLKYSSEIAELRKNQGYLQKRIEEIKEKETKLSQNIKIFEEEAELSKKRADKEVLESKSFGVTKIAKQLLEVADCISKCKNFASQSLKVSPQDSYLIKIIESDGKIRKILKKYDIEEFDPLGQEYDPNTQESLVQIPTPEGAKSNAVAHTMRTGYLINGRLLRSARVCVYA